MQRKKEVKLGDALRFWLRQEGIETPLNEFRAKEAWYELMGPGITQHTPSVEVRGGVMYIQVTNAALRNELMMNRSALLARINKHVEAQVIQSIVIR